MTSTGRPRQFGVLSDGRAVTEYTLENQNGISVGILDYGGIIRTLRTPDRFGQFEDIVLGFDNLSQYEAEHPYFGAVIGRVAGRISNGRLIVAGKKYSLPINDMPNHLHGGAQGFDHKLWKAAFSNDDRSLVLQYESADGEEGYPGRLHARVTYKLTDDNELIVEYFAMAYAPTVVNLTQHSYFNLSGDPGRPILNHILTLDSDQILELDGSSIPTGTFLDVADSRFDFREPKCIGAADANGYDNYWVLNDGPADGYRVDLCHPETGRLLQVETTAPGVQVYTGNSLPSDLTGKQGMPCQQMSGICLETQVHPDAPNRPEFPSISIAANDVFQSSTVFRFRA